MPLKSIFTVEVDDSKFKKFKELFDRYQASLKTLPAEWEKVARGVQDADAASKKLQESAQQHGETLEKNNESAGRTNIIARNTAVVWSSLTEAFVKIEKSISHSTSSLMRWSTISTAFTGLLGAGSLWGIERLAQSVSSGRRAALQQGLSYGQRNAFDLNYGRLIDAQSVLGNVATARYDVTSPQYTALLAAGVNPNKGNTGDTAVQLMQRIPQLFAGMNTNKDRGLIGAKAHAYGIDQVMSMPDLIAFLNASPEERKNIVARAALDARSMDLTEAAQRKWQDFTTQMGRASIQIESTIMEKFARLEPGLEKLSDAFVNAIKAFGDSDLLKGWIEAAAGGLDKFASYVDSPDFQHDVQDWARWIGQAAQSIWGFVTNFSKSFSMSANASTLPDGGSASDDHNGAFGSVPMNWGGGGGSVALNASGSGWIGEHLAYIKKRAAELGIDPGTAAWVAAHEGATPYAVSGNPAANDYGTSFGDFQLHFSGHGALGDQALAAGIDPRDPKNWQAADDFALEYAAKHGWGSWSAARGMDNFQGISRAPTIRVESKTGSNPVISGFNAGNPYSEVTP